MKLEVLYEDDSIVAINKPVGILVHGDGKSEQETIADLFVQQFPEAHEVGEPIETTGGVTISRPGIVHRLDKDTTGVLLLAKTQDAHAHLKQQFQTRSVKKTYRAFVYGELKNDSGVVSAPIGRAKTFGKWTAIPKALRGTSREAETHYRVLQRPAGFSYIELDLKTGRTHQIRVHMQYLNYPVVGDHVYAGKRFDFKHPENSLGFARQALHAYSIVFVNLKQELITVKAPIPLDFIVAGALE